MKNIFYLLILFTALWGCNQNNQLLPSEQKTICNPLNLNYRFCADTPSRREAADPVMVLCKNEYYWFASKAFAYWHSTNMINWDLISSTDLPMEDYTPAVMVINDPLYFMASQTYTPLQNRCF
jgi:xylan 1,4-beta-xylosidase